jgi:ubiquinone/menaquinone biosynthesis C-methylase UbiE
MDYDNTEIPTTHNQGRDHGPAVLKQWMDTVASSVPAEGVRDVLDLGCGTGRFSQGLAARFNARVIGIDPSKKMLDETRGTLNHRRVFYVCSRAEDLPLPASCIDLVFISMVFHHFVDPKAAALECKRVLRQDGRICLRTASREQIPMYPYVPFFPSSQTLLRERLPSIAFQRGVFEAAGFRTLSSDVVVQEIAPNYSSYANKLSVKADSILASLHDIDFQTGLEALRCKANTTAAQALTEPIDFLVFEKIN